MTVLEAPTLAGSRRRAEQIVQDLPEDLSGVDIELDCQNVIAAAVSFVDELVSQVLVERNARSLHVTRASDARLIGYLRDRADDHGVGARLHFDS